MTREPQGRVKFPLFFAWLHTTNTLQLGLIVLSATVAIIIGVSGFFYRASYTPLLAGGALVTAAILLAFLRRPVWALYSALFVVFLPIGLIPPEIHSILNRSLTVIALATWLFDLVVRQRRVVWTGAATFMLVFLTWGCVTLIWAEDRTMGSIVLQTYSLRLILFLLLIPNLIRTMDALHGLMKILALDGLVLMGAGAVTILLQGLSSGTRLKVLDVNENGLGILALVTILGILWQVHRPSKRNSIGIAAAIAFLALAMVLVALSGSRGSAISLLVMLFVFCLWKLTRIWGISGFLILAAGIVIAPFLFSTTLERFTVIRGDTLLGGREALWQAAWKLILDHPWRGVGIGNAPIAMIPYTRFFMSVWEMGIVAVHNPVLSIWAETGLPGVLLYLAVLGSAIWRFSFQYRRSRKAGARLSISYFALVSSVMIGYMFSWIKGGGMESDFSYFLLLALLLLPSGVDFERAEKSHQPERPSKG